MISVFSLQDLTTLYLFSETKTRFAVEETSMDGCDDMKDLMHHLQMLITYLLSSEPSYGTYFKIRL